MIRVVRSETAHEYGRAAAERYQQQEQQREQLMRTQKMNIEHKPIFTDASAEFRV